MSNLNLTEEVFKTEIVQAREAAKLADSQEPRAKSAYYDRHSQQIVIKLKNGAGFLLPPALVQGLAGASENALAEVEITPSGEGLHWEELDVDLSIHALMQGIFGSKIWMSQLESHR